MVLKILFLTFSYANIGFIEKKLELRRYTIVKALFTNQKVELINERGFATMVLNKNGETFVIYIATLAETLAI